MKGQILDYFGSINEAYIHAKGKIASQKLIELLDCKYDEVILEIGFGSGATLAHLASVFTKNTFHGLERSNTMYQTASRRIQFCQLAKNTHLHLNEQDQQLVIEENTFDKVYAESVIAIQEEDGIEKMFREIRRILKPNGVLIFNETIWLDSVDADTAKKINDACLQSFGIIQSNATLTHVSDWVHLLTKIGFEVELVVNVNELTKSAKLKVNLPTLRSNLFTFWGKMKFFFSPSLRTEWKKYSQEMTAIMPPTKMMEGMIIKATNKKV